MDTTLVLLFSYPTALRYRSADRRLKTRMARRSVEDKLSGAVHGEVVPIPHNDRGASITEVAKVHAVGRGQPFGNRVGPADRSVRQADVAG